MQELGKLLSIGTKKFKPSVIPLPSICEMEKLIQKCVVTVRSFDNFNVIEIHVVIT